MFFAPINKPLNCFYGTFDVHYFTFLLLVAHTHDTVTASTTAGMIAAVQIQGIVIG
jgi:hypothetical protein